MANSKTFHGTSYDPSNPETYLIKDFLLAVGTAWYGTYNFDETHVFNFPKLHFIYFWVDKEVISCCLETGEPTTLRLSQEDIDALEAKNKEKAQRLADDAVLRYKPVFTKNYMHWSRDAETFRKEFVDSKHAEWLELYRRLYDELRFKAPGDVPKPQFMVPDDNNFQRALQELQDMVQELLVEALQNVQQEEKRRELKEKAFRLAAEIKTRPIHKQIAEDGRSFQSAWS